VACVAFLNFIYIYVLRLNVNITIVAMVNYTAIPHVDIAVVNEECQLEGNASDEAEKYIRMHSSPDGEFVWDEYLQALVSGSFFWSYSVVQLFSGRLAEKFGTKYLFAAAQTLAAVATLCIPYLAKHGVEYMILGRFLVGLAQGVCIPVMQPLIANWATKEEKSRMSTLIVSGGQMGTILGIPLSGYLADTYGWESVFYIEGAMVVFFVGAWLLVVEDSPSTHSSISAEERAYIEAGTAGTNLETKKLPLPWRSIITSVPCWATLIATLGNNWAFYMILTELPIYLKNILHFDTKTNALWSSVPYLMMWIFSLLVANVADMTVNKGWASINFVRKASNTIAHCGTALCLIAVAFVGCSKEWTLFMLTMAVCLEGAQYSGFIINQLDLAPNFAGSLYGVINGISSVNSWLAPLAVATLTEGQQTLARWRIAFLLTAGILFFDNTIFLIFGSTEEQSWNQPKPKPDADPEKEPNAGEDNPAYNETKD